MRCLLSIRWAKFEGRENFGLIVRISHGDSAFSRRGALTLLSGMDDKDKRVFNHAVH